MSDEVKYCFDDQDVDDVLENMGDIQVRRLPVVDRDKRLVGIVSITDLAGNGDAREAGEALGDIAMSQRRVRRRHSKPGEATAICLPWAPPSASRIPI